MMQKAWSSIVEVPYCFSRSYIKFQCHTALKIVEFDPNCAFPDCNSSLNSPMAMKCCTNLETAKERCPIVFQGHPSNFKVIRYKTSPILTQIGRFRTIGRSQLSNPSDLPCSRSYVKFQGHTALKIVKFDPNWAFPDSNSSLNPPMAMKCCTKLETAKAMCPIVFLGHPSIFKVTREKTSPILTQIVRFRTIGRSQLSNPSDLPCYDEYQGILRNMHFKQLWSIMYFNYHSNWKEVYVANSSPLFETLNAVYSSALNTWSRLESHSSCLSDWVIIKLDNAQQMSYYAYFYTIYL